MSEGEESPPGGGDVSPRGAGLSSEQKEQELVAILSNASMMRKQIQAQCLSALSVSLGRREPHPPVATTPPRLFTPPSRSPPPLRALSPQGDAHISPTPSQHGSPGAPEAGNLGSVDVPMEAMVMTYVSELGWGLAEYVDGLKVGVATKLIYDKGRQLLKDQDGLGGVVPSEAAGSLVDLAALADSVNVPHTLPRGTAAVEGTILTDCRPRLLRTPSPSPTRRATRTPSPSTAYLFSRWSPSPTRPRPLCPVRSFTPPGRLQPSGVYQVQQYRPPWSPPGGYGKQFRGERRSSTPPSLQRSSSQGPRHLYESPTLRTANIWRKLYHDGVKSRAYREASTENAQLVREHVNYRLAHFSDRKVRLTSIDTSNLPTIRDMLDDAGYSWTKQRQQRSVSKSNHMLSGTVEFTFIPEGKEEREFAKVHFQDGTVEDWPLDTLIFVNKLSKKEMELSVGKLTGRKRHPKQDSSQEDNRPSVAAKWETASTECTFRPMTATMESDFRKATSRKPNPCRETWAVRREKREYVKAKSYHCDSKALVERLYKKPEDKKDMETPEKLECTHRPWTLSLDEKFREETSDRKKKPSAQEKHAFLKQQPYKVHEESLRKRLYKPSRE